MDEQAARLLHYRNDNKQKPSLGPLLRLTWVLLAIGLTASTIQAASYVAGDIAPRGSPDNTLDAGDIVVMKGIILGTLPAPTSQELLVGDVAPLGAPDNELNVADLLLLTRAVNGEITLADLIVPPNPPALVGSSTTTSNNTQLITGSTTPNMAVRLYVNGVARAITTADMNGDFSFSAALLEGDNAIYVTSWDGVSESAPSTNQFIITLDTDYAANVAVGSTPGSFSVSETGAAAYNIPMAIPPGIAGLQPSLAFTYNSQGVNGLLGVGWSISGLSGISRCAKTIATDGAGAGVALAIDDGYCLDGRRLILESGDYGAANSEYRTEIDSLSRITATGTHGNGPESFIVQTKSGQTVEYGATGDSRIEAYGATPATALYWLVNKISDTVGNAIEFQYSETTSTVNSITGAEVYPASIRYTGNAAAGVAPDKLVQFSYTDRPDTSIRYVAGSAITTTQRLSNVTISLGLVEIRDYRLAYEMGTSTGRSRLRSITECDSSTTGANCLPATTFSGYTEGSTAFTSIGTVANGIGTQPAAIKTGDFNGDGQQDLIRFSTNSNTVNTQVWLANNSGGFDAPTVWSTSIYTDRVKIGDFDADGRDDLIVYGAGIPLTPSSIKYGFGVMFLDGGTWCEAMGSGDDANHFVADFQGDGFPDILDSTFALKSLWPNQRSSRCEYTNWGSGYQAGSNGIRLGDYNGDGKMDIAELYETSNSVNAHVGLSTGSNFGTRTLWAGAVGNNPDVFKVGDFNGDGLTDLIRFDNNGNSFLWYSTGKKFISAGQYGSGHGGDSSRVHVMDVNNDGKADVARIDNNGTATVWRTNSYGLASPSGPAAPAQWGTSIGTGDPTQLLLRDFEGDGDTDILHLDTNDGTADLWTGNGQSTDILTTITNGHGVSTVVTYKPSTEFNYSLEYSAYIDGYTEGARVFNGAFYVVSEYTTSDGIGGLYGQSFSYGLPIMDSNGRGVLGFGGILQTDLQTGIETFTKHAYLWPYTGMVIYQSQSLNGELLSTTTNALDHNRYGNEGAYYYLPYVSSSLTENYELPGGINHKYSTVTTNNTYHPNCATADIYCDLERIEIVTVDLQRNETFTKITDNIYNTPDTTKWILGRLANSKVTSRTPTGQEKTRESGFVYYSSNGLLWHEVIEPNGNVGNVNNLLQTTTYTYDNFGNKNSATVSGSDVVSRSTYTSSDASTAGTPYPYTAGHFETTLTNNADHTETRTYDARFGTVSSLIGPNGLATHWTYDTFGRKFQEDRADGTRSTWTYTLCSSGCPTHGKYFVTQITSGAPTVIVYYDMLDRELRTETQGFDGTAIYRDTVYNNLGQVTKVSRPYYAGDTPYWIYFGYDLFGRTTSESLPTQANSPGPLIALTGYNGHTTAVTQYRDGTPLVTTQVKDAMGQLIAVIDADNNSTTYHYDPFGNLLEVTDPADNITSMGYDIRGRKITMDDPDMGAWTYEYNTYGELVRQTDAKSQVTEMTYDDLGRLESRSEAEGLTTWTYDDTALSGATARGKLSKIAWLGGNRSFTYDTYGRPETETTTVDGASHPMTSGYDRYSRLETITYPSGFSVRNVYSAYGYLDAVTDAANSAPYWQAPVYSASGALTAFTLGNNQRTINSYDPATGRLEGISTGAGMGSATQLLSYQYDTLGNLKHRIDGNQSNLTETFDYDNLNRLTTATIGSVVKSVVYDSIGNITKKSDVGAATWTYDPQHIHAVKTTPAGSYTYDANGNQLTGPNGRDISYTSFNQPISITANGKTHSFTYDGGHQRLTGTDDHGTVTLYINPRIDLGAHYERETHSNGSVEHKHYLYAGGDNIAVHTTRSSGVTDTRYFHKDHLGSIDTLTDEAGSVVERLSYDAWGQRRQGDWGDAGAAIGSLTHHGFTGHEMLDDVGLIHMNARLYDPALGRFLQADPIVQAPGNPQTLNRYSYAGNNPLTFVDPSGNSFLGDLWDDFKEHVLDDFLGLDGTRPWVNALVTIGLGWALGPSGYGLMNSFGAGFTAGLIGSGGDFRTAAVMGFSASLYNGIGNLGNKITFGQSAILHAAAGGTTSVLQGGKFGPGALSGGFTHFFSDLIGPPGGSPGEVLENVVQAAVVGGTASVIGGGKFANGAVTGAFSRLFNGEAHRPRKSFYDGFDKSFLADFEANYPVEHALFKEYALSIDASLWGSEFRHEELAWRNFASVAHAGSFDMLSMSARDFVISVYGPQNILSSIPGRIGVALGIYNDAGSVYSGSNLVRITNEALNIRINGPQVINEGLFRDAFGSSYDPRLNSLVR